MLSHTNKNNYLKLSHNYQSLIIYYNWVNILHYIDNLFNC